MCGRFNVDFTANKELKKVLQELNRKYPGKEIRSGEVFPTNLAAVLCAEGNHVSPEASIWGFPQYKGSGVIINARSETAFEKRTFRDSLLSRRCVIPTTGFYEWDKSKNKFLFKMKGTEVVYLAGLYNRYQEENRFVILTTNANGSMEPVHHRMPIILKEEQIEPWIFENEAANIILHTVPPMLVKEAGGEVALATRN